MRPERPPRREAPPNGRDAERLAPARQRALEMMREHYRLTKAEAAVAALIAEAHPVRETRVLGVSEFTVRAPLRNIFAKTGVNRQAALVRLVLEQGR